MLWGWPVRSKLAALQKRGPRAQIATRSRRARIVVSLEVPESGARCGAAGARLKVMDFIVDNSGAGVVVIGTRSCLPALISPRYGMRLTTTMLSRNEISSSVMTNHSCRS